jgi:hypothetical protein
LPPGFLVRAGYLTGGLRAGGAAALRGSIRHHGVVNGLGAATIFHELKFHFEFAGGFALRVFD